MLKYHLYAFCFPFSETHADAYLVFGVGCVDSLAVFAGLHQDMYGVELQEYLTGHAVKEGDIGQGCRCQEEHFPTGGTLAQL